MVFNIAIIRKCSLLDKQGIISTQPLGTRSPTKDGSYQKIWGKNARKAIIVAMIVSNRYIHVE